VTAVAERVARGTALLDERMPGWDKRIDLAALNISSACGCILGQLHGSFREGLFEYADTLLPDGLSAADHCYGFVWAARPGEDANEEVAALTAEWKRVIADRRSAP
jgi:hypothetical protein